MGEEKKKVLFRLKREECKHTKHDSVFSNWKKLFKEDYIPCFFSVFPPIAVFWFSKILIGPSDWENHSLGKYGIERYRIHNLPVDSSCPGLYELGIGKTPTDEGCKSRKLDPDNIVIVYLGQADNVRTRLQHYGRAGSHLDHGNSVAFSNTNEGPCLQRGPGLFKETFSRGYSILFRWALMTNKKEAEKTEAQLLGVFDYAWNRRGNGACRRDDILLKIDNTVTSPIFTLLRKLRHGKETAFGKKEVGIQINACEPLNEAGSSNDLTGFLHPQVRKFLKSQPRLVEGTGSLDVDYDICGVATGDGSVCRNRPIVGRKRCEEHKAKRITKASSVTSREGGNSSVCGVGLEDGSVCMEFPVHGRKRCELHKGRRVIEPKLHIVPYITPLNQTGLGFNENNPFEEIGSSNDLKSRHNTPIPKFLKSQPQLVQETYNSGDEYGTCGVDIGNGYVCRNMPILGRKKCEEHKGQRITGTKFLTSTEGSAAKNTYNLYGEYDFCGVVTGYGSVCKNRPTSGRKRCEEHKGQRITGTKLLTDTEWPATKGAYNCDDNYDVCGVITGDGDVCRKKPVSGRKRCEEHKGKRVGTRR